MKNTILFTAVLLLAGCGPKEGGIYEHLITGKKIQVDFVGSCSKEKAQESIEKLAAKHIGKKTRDELAQANQELATMRDSLLRTGRWIDDYRARNDFRKEQGHKARQDAAIATMNAAIEASGISVDKYHEITNPYYLVIAQETDRGGKCAVAGYELYTAAELKREWKKLN